MLVRVMVPAGGAIEFRFNRNATVGQLFAYVAQLEGFAEGNFYLTFNGHLMNLDQTLLAAGMVNGSTIVVNTRVRGGAEPPAENPAQMLQVGRKFQRDAHLLQIVEMLASSAFSEVYKVVDINSGQVYAMKVERKTMQRPALIVDAHVLTLLADAPGFPHLLLCGRTNAFCYVVMQMVGQSLSKLRRASPHKRFSTATALRLASQTLNRIQELHCAGFLNRDVKASNFAIGLDEKRDTIYMLDFGFARKYRNVDGDALPPRSAAALMGTMIYAPLAAHDFQEQSRKDDLESWFYMCVEMLAGCLPWNDFSETHQHRITADMKRFYRGPMRYDLLKDCPVEFDAILSLIDSFGYFQAPDYWKIRAEIKRAYNRLDICEAEPFDWEKDPSIMERSHFVGDVGDTPLVEQ